MALAAPELAALAAFAACVFLIFLYYAYGYTIGALLNALAQMFRNLSINLWFVGNVGLGFIGDALGDVDRAIRNAIGAGISFTSAGWHYMLHWSAYMFEWIGRQLADQAADTLAGLLALRDIVLPRVLAAALAPIHLLLSLHSLLWRYLPEQVHRIMSVALRELHHAISVAKSEAIAVTLPGLRGLDREAEWLRARVRSIENTLAPAALAGAVVYALSKVGFGWIKCPKVGRVAKHLCGLDESLIEQLLTGSLVIVSTLSLVDFAQELRGVMGDITPEIRHFWRADVKGSTAERQLGRAA